MANNADHGKSEAMSKKQRVVKPLAAEAPSQRHAFRIGEYDIQCLVENRNGIEVLRIRAQRGSLIVLPDRYDQVAIIPTRFKP